VRNRNRCFRCRTPLSASGGSWPVPGLIDYWKLEEDSGSRADSIGAHPLLVVGNDGPSVSGVHNEAWLFSSTDGYLQTAAFQEPDSYSLSFWLAANTDDLNPGDEIEILIKAGLGFSFDFHVQAVSNGVAKARWYVGVSPIPLESGPYTVGPFHLFIVTFDGATSQLSVDGGTFGSTSAANLPDPTSSITVWDGISNHPFIIDEIALYNRALTQTDVGILWAGGFGIFL